jgi:Xaa-Pro aminopeptidase
VLFEPGMMFTCAMAIKLPDPTPMPFFNDEQDVLVTENGVENMNAKLNHDLRVKF